jgi:hypothetical protein
VACRANVTEKVSDTIVYVQWIGDVPEELQFPVAGAVSTWSKAATSISGLPTGLDYATLGYWVDGRDVKSSDIQYLGASIGCIGVYYPSRVTTMPILSRRAGGYDVGLQSRPFHAFMWLNRLGKPLDIEGRDGINPISAGVHGGTLDQVVLDPDPDRNLEEFEPGSVYIGTAEMNVDLPFGKQPMLTIETNSPTMAPWSMTMLAEEVDVGSH